MRQFTVRNMQPRDVLRLLDLHNKQNERDKTSYPLPPMFNESGRLDSDIALALTVERQGRVVQGVYFQSRIVEMQFAGCDAAATARVRREIQAVSYTLRSLGYKGIRTLIPRVRADQLQKPMLDTGFTRTDDRFASFFLDLEATE